MSDSVPEPEQIGWQVLDPDGNVIASGPVTVVELVAEAGSAQEEEDGDGSD